MTNLHISCGLEFHECLDLRWEKNLTDSEQKAKQSLKSILSDLIWIRGPISLLVGIFFVALFLVSWYFELGIIEPSTFLGYLTVAVGSVADKLGWIFVPFFEVIRKITGLPHPPDHWKIVVILASFIPLRAILIEWDMGGKRRITAFATLLLCLIYGTLGVYLLNFDLFNLESPYFLGAVLIVFLAIEVSRNTIIAAFRRSSSDETYWQSFRFYHGINSVPHFFLAIFSILFAAVLHDNGIPGSWVLGFLLFLLCHSANMFYASMKVQSRLTGDIKGWYSAEVNRAKTAAGRASLNTLKIFFVLIMADTIAKALT